MSIYRQIRKIVLFERFSKFYPNIFCIFNKIHYLCIVHTHASGRNGWNVDILESVIDALFLAI